jgi:hypothetical protein
MAHEFHQFTLRPNCSAGLESVKPFVISREEFRFCQRLCAFHSGFIPSDDCSRPSARNFREGLAEGLKRLRESPKPRPSHRPSFGVKSEAERLAAHFRNKNAKDAERLLEWLTDAGRGGFVASLKWKRVVALNQRGSGRSLRGFRDPALAPAQPRPSDAESSVTAGGTTALKTASNLGGVCGKGSVIPSWGRGRRLNARAFAALGDFVARHAALAFTTPAVQRPHPPGTGELHEAFRGCWRLPLRFGGGDSGGVAPPGPHGTGER